MVRPANEDSWGSEPYPTGKLLVVADGMGGHRAGEVASSLAAQTVVEALKELSIKSTPPEALARAFQRANFAVYQQATRRSDARGMGTTLTAAFIDGDALIVGHVGDSRAYLVRDGHIDQITRDHSWVAERVRQGIISSEEAKTHRWRNVITNAIGSFPQLRLDLFGIELHEGDVLILCSDGLSNVLSDEELLKFTQRNQNLEKLTASLIEEANAKGSPDNVTAVMARINKINPRKRNYRLPVLGAEKTTAAQDPGDDVTNTMVIEPSDITPPLNWTPWALLAIAVAGVIALFFAFTR